MLMAALGVMALPAASRAAPTQANDMFATAPMPGAVRPMQAGESVLDPRRFLQLVVARNAEIAYAQLQADIAARGLDAESTVYQITSYGGIRHEQRERQRTVEEQLSTLLARVNVLDENVNTLESGVKWRTPSGADMSLSVRHVDRRNNLIATTNGRTLESNASMVLTLRQPLLKGAGRDAVETDLRIAELEFDIGRWQYRQQLMKMGGDALGAYWQLQRAYLAHPIRLKLLDNARDALRDVREREASGRVPPTAESETMVVVSARESDVFKSLQTIAEAEARVRVLLDLPPTDGKWALFDDWSVVRGIDTRTSPDARLASALDAWPAYRVARLRVEQGEYRMRFAKNQTLPQLDVQASYGTNGLAYGQRDAISIASRDRYPDWYVGIGFEVPIGSVTRASAQYEGQALKLRQAELESQNVRNSLMNDLFSRAEAYRLTLQDVDQLNADLGSRTELLTADRNAFRDNLAPRARLLRREADVLESRLRLLEGEARLHTARTLLSISEGSLLTDYGIEVFP